MTTNEINRRVVEALGYIIGEVKVVEGESGMAMYAPWIRDGIEHLPRDPQRDWQDAMWCLIEFCDGRPEGERLNYVITYDSRTGQHFCAIAKPNTFSGTNNWHDALPAAICAAILAAAGQGGGE